MGICVQHATILFREIIPITTPGAYIIICRSSYNLYFTTSIIKERLKSALMHVIHCIAFFLLKYADGLSVNKLYLFREKNSLNL